MAIQVKRCSLCKEDVGTHLFRRCDKTRDGLQERCKPCKKKLDKEYREKNKEKIAQANKVFYYSKLELNRERSRNSAKKSYNNNKEKQQEKYKQNKNLYNKRSVEYRKNNIEKVRNYVNNYVKRRKLTDPAFKIRYLLKSRMWSAIKRGYKKQSTKELLGCEYDFLRKHIEDKFALGMTWSNHGEWEIDHIIPVSSFDLTIEEEQKKCFHYTNMQPLWMKDNRKKGNKILCMA